MITGSLCSVGVVRMRRMKRRGSEEEERDRERKREREGERGREGDKSNKSAHVTAAVFNGPLMEEPQSDRTGGGVRR